MRYGSCTYEEIARLAAGGAVALLPLGCTEQQGPHLPVDFDSWFAGELAIEAAERARRSRRDRARAARGSHRADSRAPKLRRRLPRPARPFARCAGHGHARLAHSPGFRAVVIWRGCGGHDLRQAVASYTQTRPAARVYLPDPPLDQIWRIEGDSAVPGGHADSFTTSIMLARRPALVRLDRIPPPSRIPDWQDPDLDFGAYSDSGVIGDPQHASAELGERLWKAAVTWATRYLAAVADQASAIDAMPDRSNASAGGTPAPE